jgi:hypothetical protein
MALRALAREAASTGDARAAHGYLARARAVATRRESAHEHAAIELCHAEILALLDPGAEMQARALSARGAFEALGMPWHADRARALLGGGERSA